MGESCDVVQTMQPRQIVEDTWRSQHEPCTKAVQTQLDNEHADLDECRKAPRRVDTVPEDRVRSRGPLGDFAPHLEARDRVPDLGVV